MGSAGQKGYSNGSTLEVPLPREHFLSDGKGFMYAAAGYAAAAALGWIVATRLFSMAGSDIFSVSWVIGFTVLTVLFAFAGYCRYRWAKGGPDLWLRITPKGVEFVEIGISIAHHSLSWPDIARWWMMWINVKRRAIRIHATDKTMYTIHSLDYVHSRAPWKAAMDSALALELDIEALFKKYAPDRQGEAEGMAFD